MNSRYLHRIRHQHPATDPASSSEALERLLPPKPTGMTWRDYVLMLLHTAAQLEHALMVQYLYAGYSLGISSVSEPLQASYRKWQREILTVAREEMGHLMTVQNVICLLGGSNSFAREDFPWDSPFFPYPFHLEAGNEITLARFLFAEMPPELTELTRSETKEGPLSEAQIRALKAHLGQKISEEVKLADPFASPKEMQSAALAEESHIDRFIRRNLPRLCELIGKEVVKNNRLSVSILYERIIELIGDPNLLHDSDFRAETYEFQASWDDWGRGYKPAPHPMPVASDTSFQGHSRPGHPPQTTREGGAPATEGHSEANVLIFQAGTRTEALTALRQIAEQGESPDQRHTPTNGPSHFARFAQIFDEFQTLQHRSPHADPIGSLPKNPTTLPPEDAGLTSETPLSCITYRPSLYWAELLNLRYRLLLTYLTHTFRLARVVPLDEPNVRGALMHKIFGEMYNIKTLSALLFEMPLTDPNLPERAGPSFEMPYDLDLPPEQSDCWHLYRDILRNAVTLSKTLLGVYQSSNQEAPSMPPYGKDYLLTLIDLDQKSIDWLQHLPGGRKAAYRN